MLAASRTHRSRWRRGVWRAAACLRISALALLSGCLPMLSHDTRVSPGTSLTLHFGIQAGTRERAPAGKATPHVPAAGVQLAVAGRDSAGLAGRLAAGFGLFNFAPNLDAYLQFASGEDGGLDAGAGVGGQMGVFPAVLPYLQFGRDISRGRAWFTSHHVGWVRTGNVPRWQLVWMPTLALLHRNDRTQPAMHVFVTAIIGSRGEDCARESCPDWYSRSERTFLIVGVAGEIPIAGRFP